MSAVFMLKTGYFDINASVAPSSMRSGCSCMSIHLSTPMAAHLLHVAGARAEGETIEHLLNLLVGKQLAGLAGGARDERAGGDGARESWAPATGAIRTQRR